MTSRNRVTLSEVAEQSGVSVTTASLALRDKAGVGPDTRRHVLSVARELGYIPKSDTKYIPILTSWRVLKRRVGSGT